jgi:hypothetical protein
VVVKLEVLEGAIHRGMSELGAPATGAKALEFGTPSMRTSSSQISPSTFSDGIVL